MMTNRIRKAALVTHIVFSVGWLGAVVAYLALVITLLFGENTETISPAVWASMESIGWYALIPLAIGALLSGLVMSLGTAWGLFRYYWVIAKLVLTAFATLILIVHMPSVSLQAGGMATMSHINIGGPRSELVHAGGGLVVLLAITILAVYKPWGMTAYGRRKRPTN
jgi:hypothetical protein